MCFQKQMKFPSGKSLDFSANFTNFQYWKFVEYIPHSCDHLEDDKQTKTEIVLGVF